MPPGRWCFYGRKYEVWERGGDASVGRIKGVHLWGNESKGKRIRAYTSSGRTWGNYN